MLPMTTKLKNNVLPRRRSSSRVLCVLCGSISAVGNATPIEFPTYEGVTRDDSGRWRLEKLADGRESRGTLESKVIDLSAGQTSKLSWLAQWTTPVRFNKHERNPIYGPDQTGEWDNWTNGVSIVPLPDGKRYRMYYGGRANAGIGFAEGTVADPLTWEEHPSSPVLKPLEDTWEGSQINQPRVVMVTPEHWRMYYTGWGFKGLGTTWAMGIAESFDGGTTWKRLGDKPFMDRGDENSPDGGGACVPMVVRVGDKWMMWYTAGLVPKGEKSLHIHLCLAYSDDGIHWAKHPGNPVLGDDFSDGAKRNVTSRCYVRHDDGIFRMWYSYAKPDYRIGYAESLDGIHWERAPVHTVLDNSPAPAWDDKMVEYPEVQIVDGVFRLWFCGNGFGSVGYATGKPETGVKIRVRTGDTPTPDNTWTEWHEATRGNGFGKGRYAQVRAELWSTSKVLSPTLNEVTCDSEQ